ncbi:MAG: hypothetical protein FJX68_01990 [Alphaproteobacteria bacterium]|nr:hypothetical protein [Alphaproteobacteria bacterium]
MTAADIRDGEKRGRPGRLAFRYGLVLLLWLALSGALATALAGRAVDEAYREQARSRAGIVLADLSHSIEMRMSLGLPLGVLREIQDALERERAKDDQILSIEVFDERGRSLFNTDRGLIGDPIEQGWVELARAGGDGLWGTTDFEAEVVGVALRNSFDKPVGGIALRYSRSAFEQRAHERFATVAAGGLVAMALSGVLLALGVLLAFRPFRRQYLAFLAAADGRATSRPLPAELAEALDGLRRADATLAALAGATREVQAIDAAA